MTPRIYRPWNFGLGDNWATCSLMRWKGLAAGERQLLSTKSHGVDLRPRLEEIEAQLDMTAWAPILVDDPPSVELDGFDVWAAPAVPTRVRWSPIQRFSIRQVAFQFDGQSTAADKNPPAHEADAILQWLVMRGFEPVQLGRHLSLSACVRILSESALFVGCRSGMSCLAHSVGTPAYIYEHRHPVITCHRQKQLVIVRNAADFESQARPFLDLLDRLQGDR